jgi:hypothetical protein
MGGERWRGRAWRAVEGEQRGARLRGEAVVGNSEGEARGGHKGGEEGECPVLQ